MPTPRTISIRLTVAEADQFKQAFQQAGAAGQSAMNTLTQSVTASTGALHGHTQAAGLANYQIIELTESAHKFADIILSGGSAIRGLEFELPKFIGIAGGVTQALGALGKALPLLGIAAAAAGIYELGKAAEAQQSRMALLGQQVRATRDDYGAYAKTLDDTARKLSQTTPISLKDARETINTIGTNPNFSGNSNDMLRLGTDAEGLSVVMKTSLADATKLVTASLDNATEAAKKFEQQGIYGFTPGLVRSVELLDQIAKHGDATSVVLQTLEARTSGAATAGLTPLGQAMAHFGEAMDKTRESGRSFAETIGKSFTDMAASVVSGLGTMIDKLADWQAAEERASQGNGITIAKPGAPLTTIAGLPFDPFGAAAKASGVDIALLRAQSTLESSGNPNAVSSAGAVGLMGVMPGTFADMQKKYGFAGSITDPNANVMAGALYMRQMLDQQGSLRSAASAYNEGPGNFAKGLMPDETRNYSTALTRAYPYGNGIVGPVIAPGALASGTGVSLPSASAGSYNRRDFDPSDTLSPSSDMVNEDRKSAADVAKEIEGTRAARSQSLTAELAKIEAQMEQLRSSGRAGSTEYMGLAQREQDTNRDIYNNVDPQTQALREGQRQLDSGRLARRYGFTPAGDQLAASMAQGEDLARTSGSPFTDADKAQRQSQFYQKADMELTRLDATQAAATAGNERLAAAYAKGGTAVAELTARNEALQQINLIMPPTAATYAAAVDKQTESNLALARSLAKVKAEQVTNSDNLAAASAGEQMRLITSGESQNQQAQDYAAFQARQANQLAPQSSQDDAAKSASDRVKADQALNSAKANYNELESFGSNTFDKLGSSMTSAFMSGANAAKSFSGIAKSVFTDLAQEFEKLAVLNPIKNAIFGGNSPTLGSVGGLLGGLLGTAGGAAAASSAAAITSGAGTTGIGLVLGGLYHSGGIVGMEPTSSRLVDPMVFYNAPRFHSGGIAGGEVPAVLQAGEAVLTPGQMAALGKGISSSNNSGDTHFNFNVNAQGAGPREIDMLRTQMPLIALQATQAAAQRGGSYAKAIRGS